MSVDLTLAHARALDDADVLRRYRTQFHVPHADRGAYLCGHSLGLQPKKAAVLLQQELESWALRGVEGHFEGERPWATYHEQSSSGLAQIVGADPLEVVAMNTLTINLHLMLASFYRPTPARHRILIEQRAFSSDRYAVASQIRWHGFDPQHALLEASPRPDEDLLRTEDICALIEREAQTLALVMLPGVQYLTGQLLDMQAIAACARKVGVLVGFDLAHAVGNAPLRLHDWDVDFAVWCSYKYLNAGPGAIAGCFVHERHGSNDQLPRLAGWWGHDKHSRFQMPDVFTPLPGAEGWQVSNLPILSTAPLLASLELFTAAGMDALRSKSLQLTGYFEALLRARLPREVSVVTASDPAKRGCQLSMRLHTCATDARRIFAALIAHGCIGDWREPDVIRAAPAPLYNGFADVWRFVDALHGAMHGAPQDNAR